MITPNKQSGVEWRASIKDLLKRIDNRELQDGDYDVLTVLLQMVDKHIAGEIEYHDHCDSWVPPIG